MESKKNPFWKQFLWEKHALEITYGEVHRYYRHAGRYPSPDYSINYHKLCGFVVGFIKIYDQLSDQAKQNFAGSLTSALDSRNSLGPLAFEISAAVNLVSCGFDIEFHDRETGGGYDFLVTKGATRIEFECKHLSADAGRKIHRRELHMLGGILQPRMEHALRVGSQGQLVHVSLPDRLTSDASEQRTLADSIVALACGETDRVDNRLCTASVQFFPLDDCPMPRGQDAYMMTEMYRDYLYNRFGIEESSCLIFQKKYDSLIIVSIQSKKPDSILGSVFDRLKKDTKKQFSTQLPAFLCIGLADVTDDQLKTVANIEQSGKVTTLQLFANNLLKKRPHLYGLSVVADNTVESAIVKSSSVFRTSTQLKSTSYVFRNPNHPMASELLEFTFFGY